MLSLINVQIVTLAESLTVCIQIFAFINVYIYLRVLLIP